MRGSSRVDWQRYGIARSPRWAAKWPVLALALGCTCARPNSPFLPILEPVAPSPSHSPLTPNNERPKLGAKVSLSGFRVGAGQVESSAWSGRHVVIVFSDIERALEGRARATLHQWRTKWQPSELVLVWVSHSWQALAQVPAASMDEIVEIDDPQGAWALQVSTISLPSLAILDQDGRVIFVEAYDNSCAADIFGSAQQVLAQRLSR
jgi:hypothetical protein